MTRGLQPGSRLPITGSMRILRLLLPLAAVAASLTLPGAAHAARGLEVALQDDGVFVFQGYYNRELALAQAQRLGVTHLRVNVLWARVALGAESTTPPAERVYDWPRFDELISDAARYGIRIQMTVVGPAPAWATGNRKIGNDRPNAAAFAQFAADTAAHFKGKVSRYSVWNEPNWHTWLIPSKDCRKGRWGRGCDAKLASAYRALYTGAYAAIKYNDPAAKVHIGELAPQGRKNVATSPLAMLRELTCSKKSWKAARRCAPLRADGFAHHPYAFTVKPSKHFGGPEDVTLATLSRLTKALDRLAKRRALATPDGKRLDLYLTEHGYFASGKRKLSQAKRAAYLRQSFDIALRHPRVRQLLQYLLVAPPAERDTFPTQIADHSGREHLSFGALADWTRSHAGQLARPLVPKPT